MQSLAIKAKAIIGATEAQIAKPLSLKIFWATWKKDQNPFYIYMQKVTALLPVQGIPKHII